MTFTRGEQCVHLYLHPRSVAILTGEARYQWYHGIAARKTDVYNGKLVQRTRRISITFRSSIGSGDTSQQLDSSTILSSRLRAQQASCSAAEEEDSIGTETESSSIAALPRIEQEHVVNLYDTIASHFSSTRHSGWPSVTKFINELPFGSIVADVGTCLIVSKIAGRVLRRLLQGVATASI